MNRVKDIRTHKVGAITKKKKTRSNIFFAVMLEKTDFKTDLADGVSLKLNQVLAVVMKKFLATWRSWILFLLQICLPIVLLVITVLNVRAFVPKTTFEALEITLDSYPEPITLLSSYSPNKYVEIFQNLTGRHGVMNSEDITSDILQLVCCLDFISCDYITKF